MTDFTIHFCNWFAILPATIIAECVLAFFNAYWDESEQAVKSHIKYEFVCIYTAILTALVMSFFYEETYRPIVHKIISREEVPAIAIFGIVLIVILCFSVLLVFYDASYSQREIFLEDKNTKNY